MASHDDMIDILPDICAGSVTVPDVKGVPHQYPVSMPFPIAQNFKNARRLLKNLKDGTLSVVGDESIVGFTDIFAFLGFLIGSPIYRGVADAKITKGGSGLVSRYNPSTTTDSGTNDTVVSELQTILIGRKVIYAHNGANFYALVAEQPVETIYRGITTAQITKGGSGSVSRYTAGTTTASGTTDTVTSEYETVGTGMKVAYAQNGDTLYVISAEKTELEVVLDFRVNSGSTQIEAQTVTTQLPIVASPAYENKIPLTACP